MVTNLPYQISNLTHIVKQPKGRKEELIAKEHDTKNRTLSRRMLEALKSL